MNYLFERLPGLTEKIRPHLIPAGLLVLAVLAVYGRILGHDFIRNWDDNRYILENADIQGFDWDRLKAVFSTYYVGNYAPVQMLSYMADYRFWGLWPGGYLLTNLVVHTANGLLLYRLLLNLLGGRLAAWSAAALFLLHPVQVETVAWVSQRKNLLAMLFFLIAWQYYLVWRERGPERRVAAYVLSCVSIALAMLSKSIAVIFPVTLALFDYCYPSEKRTVSLRSKLPYLAIALVMGIVAIVSQTPDPTEWGAGGGRTGYHGGSPVTTFFSMVPVFCRYLAMILWPASLSPLYEVPVRSLPDVTVIGGLLLLAVTCYLAIRLFRHDRRLGYWPLFSVCALLPVAQIVPLITLMNDRYLYFPLIGVAALAGYGIDALVRRGMPVRRIILLVCIPLLALAVASWSRAGVWRNSLTLWEDASRKNPDAAMVWEILGEAYHYHAARPDYAAAIKAYYRAIELNSKSDLSRYNLGIAYMEQNDLDNADRVFRELLKLSPQNVMGWAAYGDLALKRFDYAEAEKRYDRARVLQPEAVPVHRKIANLMVVTGRLEEARKAHLRIETLQGGNDPLNAYELALVESLCGDATLSLEWLEIALKRGFNDYAGIMNSEELAPVRMDGRFDDLVTRFFPKR